MNIACVLQASSVVLQGGAEIQTDYLVSQFLKHNHRVAIISDLINAETRPRIKDVEYLFLKSHGRKHSYLNAKPLLGYLKNFNPDIVYNRWKIAYSGIAAFYAKRYGKSMVLNIASARDAEITRPPINPFFVSNCIVEYLGRYGLSNADVVVAQNKEQQKAMQSNYGRDCICISSGHPVPNGPFLKQDIPIIIWVANIKPVKQLEIFIQLADTLQSTNAKFVCVGRPSSGYYMEKILKKTNGLDNFVFTGEVPHEEANRLISSASILVNTSLNEGFPNTFIQAWLRETPVISLNANPSNILTEERIGFCSNTFDQLVNDVRILLDNKSDRIAMGQRAREYAIIHHDITMVGAKYLKLFEQLHNKH